MPFRLRPVPRVVAAACTLASSSLAAPSISTVSGAAQHGSSVTITGDGFGTKTTAEPLKWDDFEDGALGNDVSTTGYWENHGNGDIKFSDEHLRHPFSKRSVTDKMTYTWPSTTPNGNFYHLKAWPNAGRKYLTGYLYIEFPKLSTSGDWQAKLIHVLSGPEHADWPVLALQSWWTEGGDVGNNGNYFEFQYTGGAWPSSWNDWARAGEWLRFEVEWKDSTSASASDGMARFSAYHPGESVVSVTKSGTTMGSDGVTLSTPHFGYLLVNEGAGHQVDTTWDDIYMDDTWARVELCDGATWESRTDCEIQPPTAWTPSSITVTLNQGALSEGQTAYVYVVDAAGSANGSGYPITLSAGTAGTGGGAGAGGGSAGGAGGGSAGGAGSGGQANDGGAGVPAATPNGDDSGSCGCRVPSPAPTSPPFPWSAGVLALLGLTLRRRAAGREVPRRGDMKM